MHHHQTFHGYASIASSIQPSVKAIADLARGCDQHIVRLYYLPTPNSNGFTTTHTLVSTSNFKHHGSAATTRNRSYSVPYGRSNHHDQDDSEDPGPRQMTHLTRVSESERGTVYLARLRITDMVIATSSLPYLSHLVSLRLQGNQLTDLPLQIFRLPSLRELDVSQNFLTEISGLIGMLAPTLEELFLQSNRLQSLPQQLGRLRRLRLLDIADNYLGCIPVEVQRLVSESFSSERRRVWRLYESGLPASGQGNDDTPTAGEGSQQPRTPTYNANTPHSHGDGGVLHSTPIEDGGHDDDDYVQIRQGMKCWARGNRFWQVKVPRSSVLLSPIAATTTMLLAGPTLSSPTSSASSTPSSSLSSGQHSPTATSTPNHIGSPLPPPTTLPRFTNRTQSISSGNSSNTGDWPNIPHHHHHHSGPYSNHQHKGQYPYPQNHPQQGTRSHPEHFVDRRGYCKDSYTSCSWTLSLVDICSQIVGQTLQNDPHYYCHSNACPYKKTRRTSKDKTPSPSTQDLTRRSDSDTEEEHVEDCTVTMMPEWMIEQLGLFHLAEMRNSFYDSRSDSSLSESADMDQHSTENDKSSLHHGTRPGISDVPAPMPLTLVEKEMECEFCSVCQRRLYFSGMRWKDVGVMDERIVPLEWVACSVQCRARVEREERREGYDSVNQATTPTSTTTTSTMATGAATTMDTSITTTTAESTVSPGNQNGSTRRAGPGNPVSSDTHEDGGVVARPLESQVVFPNGVSTRVNTLESRRFPPAQPRAATDVVPRPHPPPPLLAPQEAGSILRNEMSASPAGMEETMSSTEGLAARSQHRDYRETILYGLIQSRALRRRTRALSL